MTSLDELQGHIDQFMNERNNRPVPEFEGYSPFEMQHILYDTFGEKSPIKLRKMTGDNYKLIPILNQIKYLGEIISRTGEVKLTKLGFLPTKVVTELYNQGFIKEYQFESGISKLYKEMDSTGVHVARVLMEISGLAKKRNNKISLTKQGEKILRDDYQLCQLILKTYGEKFNWAHLDYYGENNIGQLGFGFSLILFHKYGHLKRTDKFYNEKYFNAFPMLLESISYPTYTTKENYAGHCYTLRTFDRFLNFFGGVVIEQERGMDAEKFIVKGDVFDRMFEILPHSSNQV
ncbi:hypothetical protein [Maribellus mangrovi]|uniref:hypothetical protein n=1 Tax=Maribellus mangrovi TaxID=3133146 RepID=UPI0030ED70C2